MIDSTPPIKKIGNFVSPLRYPGGKGRIGPWLAKVLQANRLLGGQYVEPYAGGAGAALYLLLHNHVASIVLNDADPAVHAFWKVLTENPRALIAQVKKHEPSMETWFLCKAVLKDPQLYSLEELAFATFFINRTSRSGILNGGVVGGKNQSGKYKLDARYKTNDLIFRLESIAERSEQIQIHHMDAIDLLKNVVSSMPSNTLIFMDPPYYAKGSLLYRNCYDHEDHVQLEKALHEVKRPFLLTYDNAEEIQQIFHRWDSSLFSFTYSTHLSRPLANEILFYGNVEIPGPPVMTRGKSLD